MSTNELPPLAGLLPCPFCGHDDSLIEYHNPQTVLHPWYRIECDYCGAKGPGSDRGDHREQWNARTALASAQPSAGGGDDDELPLQEALAEECQQLRIILSQVTSALGTGAFASSACSLEFLRHIPEEVRKTVEALRGAAPSEPTPAAADALAAEFERGRQQGMEQERAMWELAKLGQFVPCRCFDETARRLCVDKGRCSRIVAAAAPTAKAQEPQA